MKRVISAVLTLLLISGCVVPPRQLVTSDAVADVTEPSQFSPVPAESVKTLKAPNTHDNQRWYVKYSKHIAVAWSVLSFVAIAWLCYAGWTEHSKALRLAEELDTLKKAEKKTVYGEEDKQALCQYIDLVTDELMQAKEQGAALAHEIELIKEAETEQGRLEQAERVIEAERFTKFTLEANENLKNSLAQQQQINCSLQKLVNELRDTLMAIDNDI